MDYFIFYKDKEIVFEGRGTWFDVAERGLNKGELKQGIEYRIEKFQMCLDDYFEEVF
ncbi:MAG: hypothetical protein ACRDBY_12880 [Cetobacterium sp.]